MALSGAAVSKLGVALGDTSAANEIAAAVDAATSELGADISASSVTATSGTFTTSTITNLVVTNVARTGVERLVQTRAKVGGTAGWTVGAGDDLPYMATMAASQTAGTLIVPLDGLHVGDTITGFKVVGQIESAGNTVTIDANLRAITAVAGEPTDTSVKSITQVSVTADTILNDSATASYAVVATQTPYLLITGTTGASTDVILMGATVTVTEA